jgi:hypothetical protein
MGGLMPRSPLALVVALVAAVAISTGPAHAQAPASAGGGPVALEGRAFTDRGGPFLPLGASLFWALWGEQHDPQRLDRNLAWLAAQGVDYVRVLGMVGAESWSDRRIDPRDPDYWPAVERLFVRLSRHRLRAQVTIFADAQVVMPRRAERQAFVDAWAVRAEAHRAHLMLLEVANEHRQNGLEDIDELRALGQRLARRTRVLVALSAASPATACRAYADAGVDLATVHYPRGSSDDEPWDPVGRPWSWPGAYDPGCRGRLPAAVNNEPIGPQSSVAADEDPRRLVMAFVTTFVAGNSAYVLHAGPGIRGGGAADLAAGRSTDWMDIPTLTATLAGMRAAREHLPPDLANWRRRDVGDSAHPFIGFDQAVRGGAVNAVYAATLRNRFVVAVLGARREVVVRARTRLVVTIRDPISDARVEPVPLRAGERLTLVGTGAFVLTGESVER